MSKKKNNRQNNQQQRKTTAIQQPTVVTQTMVNEARQSLEDSSSKLDSIPEEVVNVTEIKAVFVTDGSISCDDVEKCVKDLNNRIRIMDATQRSYEKAKADLEDARKELKKQKSELDEERKKLKDNLANEYDAERKAIEAGKAELAAKRNALNERELKLIEEENAVQNGDHSAVIETLLKVFKQYREDVIEGAENFIKGQTDTAKKYLEQLGLVTAREAQLEIEEKALRIREKKCAAFEDYLEEEKNEMKEELRREYEDKSANQLASANEELERYKTKLEKCEQNKSDLNAKLETIVSAFGDIEPSDMVDEFNSLKSKLNYLQSELESRPTQESFDTKQREVEMLENQLKELRNEFNENEYLQLKAMFENNDVLISDKQLLQCKLESAEVREKSLHDTIDDLRKTIAEINETHNKDNAFKAASKYDQGDYQQPMIREKAPQDLPGLISYLQSFMASPNNGDKELKYSKDTIKKFVAGLHMSPISILQGISGTGKTSLPRAVAMALTAGDARYSLDNGEDELPKAAFRICPVQSGWRDKMDLMGFYNSFEKSYHETEFFNALYLANQPKYENTLFFIVLDEMNLSRPEHYFADFLSKLEQSEDQRKIKVDNVPDIICPHKITGGTLAIPRNVRFIGTANHDETTLEFAPKTYDRSNVIDMPRNCPADKIPDTKERYCISYGWLNSKFEEAVQKQSRACQLFEKFIKDEELLNILAERGIGIGNRFEGQAKRFISVFVDAGDDPQADLAKAADHLMTTRLLRSLKDNFDLSIDALDEFKEHYEDRFIEYFSAEPEEALELIDTERRKKDS